MSSSYTGNPSSVDSPSPAPNLSGNYPIATLPADGDSLAAASVGQEARLGPNWVAYALERMRDQIFGSGVDGANTASLGSNLSAYILASTWTAGSGTSLLNCTWPIIARQSITFANCTISGSAAAASGITIMNYGVGTTPGPHGCTVISRSSISNANTYYTSANFLALGGGVASVVGVPHNIVSPGSQFKTYPYRFGSGAQLGVDTSATTNGGLFGTQNYDSIRGGLCGVGAGGATGSGGAPGAGGALVVLMAPVINLTNVSFVSNGGAGGTPPAGNANGGNGGGGGAFLFVCQTLIQSGCTYTANGGAAGVGAGTGSGGSPGSAGNVSPYIVYVP